MNAGVRGSVFTDHHGKCAAQECVGVCFHCWLGPIQKHLTHMCTLAKHTIKTYASIQINKYDLSLMQSHANPILDRTDLQVQIEEENTQEELCNQSNRFV